MGCPKYTDDKSTESTEFFTSTGDWYPKPTAYNASLELPVIYRSKYKILVYPYKILNGAAPRYLEQFVVSYQPTRFLSSESLITVTKSQAR